MKVFFLTAMAAENAGILYLLFLSARGILSYSASD